MEGKSFNLTLGNTILELKPKMKISSIQKELERSHIYQFEPYIESLILVKHTDIFWYTIKERANAGRDKQLLKIFNKLRVNSFANIYIGSGGSNHLKWIMTDNTCNNIENISSDLGISAVVNEIILLEHEEDLDMGDIIISHVKCRSLESGYIRVDFKDY